MCSPSPHFNGSYCGKYSFAELKYIEELIKYDQSKTEGAFCMVKEDWLKKMKPYLKKMKRKVKDGD